MNKKNIFYAALLLMAIGAEAKEIKGKVMADGKGLAKVVVTDGTAFALTSEDGRVGGEVFYVEEGETLIMPKDIPHAVYGEERFKMQLTVSF